MRRVDLDATFANALDALGESKAHLAWNLLSEAHNATRELVAANRAEYEAQQAYDGARTGRDRNEKWEALLGARARRLRALAAFE